MSKKNLVLNHHFMALLWTVLFLVLAAGPASAVTVVSPDGGEKIAAGSVYDIQWVRLKDEVSYIVKYSLDGGKSWVQVAKNVKGASYAWNVPTVSETQSLCFVLVIAYDSQGRRLRSDRSDNPFTIETVKSSDFLPMPQPVNPGYEYKEPPPLGPNEIPPDVKGGQPGIGPDQGIALGPSEIPWDVKGDGTTYTENHSGLMCDNSILIELGSHANAGSNAKEIQFKVGDGFTIHLLGGAGVFVPGAALLYKLPGSCEECYKSIPPDDWDKLTLVTNTGDGIQIHRVVLVKSCETVLDVTVDAWLDKYYQKVLDFSVDTAGDKWDDVGHSRVTDIYYAAQDLGQTGAQKYVNADVWWCSEFASYMIRKNGLSTPTGSIGTSDLLDWFQDHGRYRTRAQVKALTYTVRAGDYMSLWDGGHSVIFRGWVNETPKSQDFDDESEFNTIEGNAGNAVRTQTRKWGDVDWVGSTQ